MSTARTVAKLSALGLFALAGLGLGGCQVNHDTYDQLLNGYNALKARNVELTDENTGLRATVDEMRGKMGSGSEAAGEALSMNAKLRAELEARNRDIDALNARLAGIDFNPVALDRATDSALQQLAAQFPDVLTYDSARGMLRFTSDVTFASGNYVLTDAGARAVREFARILVSTPAAGQYDILVAGHTDTQPVTLRDGRKFSNNGELSAFRALSVRDAMVSGGIEPHRVGALAYGETRPAIQNAANGNTPQNRRVEVYLTKGNYSGLTAKPVASRRVSPAAAPTTTTPRSSTTTAPSNPGSSSSSSGGSDIEIAK